MDGYHLADQVARSRNPRNDRRAWNSRPDFIAVLGPGDHYVAGEERLLLSAMGSMMSL